MNCDPMRAKPEDELTEAFEEGAVRVMFDASKPE